jgi:hypothetical protein
VVRTYAAPNIKTALLIFTVGFALFATGAFSQGFNYDLFKPNTLAAAKADFIADAAEPNPAVQNEIGNSYLDPGGRRWRAAAAIAARHGARQSLLEAAPGLAVRLTFPLPPARAAGPGPAPAERRRMEPPSSLSAPEYSA